MTEDTHKRAIEANLKEFDAKMAVEYDKKESTQFLSILFAKLLLEYNVERPRKSPEQSYPLIGNTEKRNNGFTPEKDLPDPGKFGKEFPNSVFKPGIKLMDFACGTGVVSQYFAPYLASTSNKKSEIIGVDINRLFLDKYNDKANEINTRYDGVTMTSHLCDILDFKSLEVQKFEGAMDVIVCTISYHHIENYEKVTKKLATFLKPEGWLFIIDFYNEDVEHSPPDARHVSNAVRHMGGLKIDALNKTLKDYAGLSCVSSAREARVYLWHDSSFIENHMRQEIIDKLKNNQLRSKISDGTTLYLVEASLILATGQKEVHYDDCYETDESDYEPFDISSITFINNMKRK